MNEPIRDGESVPKVKRQETHELELGASVDLTWENLTYKVPVEDKDGNITYKELIHSFSGRAQAGRVLAIMGPSGAGKTTLMGAITGKLYNPNAIMEGCCFLNNNIYQQRYKKLVSYVSQDDIVMGKDTPREAINFAARLRLGFTVEEANKRTDEVISQLSLKGCQNTILGIPGILKGVSGGERKRSNIGTELVTNPCIMLLDEPTTGLDSVNAVRLGQQLQDLAKKDKRTVIATIHSPSSELFGMFDDLLLLSKGHVIYHGPTADSVNYFAQLGFKIPLHTNPAEYFMNLLQLPDKILSQLWLAWEDYVVSDAAESNMCLAPVTGRITLTDDVLEKQLKMKEVGYGVQFTELFKRCWRLFLRDPAAFYGRLAQSLFFAFFFGIFYFNLKLNQGGIQDRRGLIYVLTTNIIFGSCFTGVSSFPPERAVFLQEQATDTYNAFIFFLAKNIAEFPWQVLFATIVQLVVYFMAHFYRSAAAYFISWLVFILMANFGYALGLMLSSFFADAQVAFAISPVIFLPLFIVSGQFANTARLDPYWIWLNYLSFPRMFYVGLYVNEFSRVGAICQPVTADCIYADGNAVIVAGGFTDWKPWKTIVGLTVYQIGLRVIGAASLYYQGSKRRGRLMFAKNLRRRVASLRAIASARSNDNFFSDDSTLINSVSTPTVVYRPTHPENDDHDRSVEHGSQQ